MGVCYAHLYCMVCTFDMHLPHGRTPFRAGKYGIYSLLDAHQDVLSQKFCGEGIPDWAVDTGRKR